MHSSQIHGAIALKRSTAGLVLPSGKVVKDGLESEAALQNLINKEKNGDVREVLETYKNFIMGHALYDPSQLASRITTALRDLAYARLALTQFAMGSEYATMAVRMITNNSARKEGFLHIGNLLRSMVGQGAHNANSAAADTMVRLTGHGSATVRRSNSVKSIDSMYNVSEIVGGTTAEKFARSVKYISLHMSRIMQADDAMKRTVALYHRDEVALVVDGTKTMSANRRKRFGITDEFIEMFKGKMPKDSRGELLDDFDAGWTTEMREAYGNVLHRLIMTDSPEAILSSLPVFSATSNMGRLLGFMTSFMAQTYTTKALAGMKFPDSQAAMETMVYFMGTFMGLYSRDLATGKDPKMEDVMYRALLMMPIASPIGLASMAQDPMVLGTPADTFRQMHETVEAFR
jgi:predicted proteasome-type protease